jgi:hypothetical protein
LSVSGYLTNDEDSLLARFSTNSKGLGKFKYFDEDNVKYTVHIKGDNGHDLTKVLPNSVPNAARISITKQTDTSITLLIALGDALFKEEAPTTIMGFNKDKLIYAASGRNVQLINLKKLS